MMMRPWTLRTRRLLALLGLLLALLATAAPAHAYNWEDDGGGSPHYRCGGLSAADDGGPTTDRQCGW